MKCCFFFFTFPFFFLFFLLWRLFVGCVFLPFLFCTVLLRDVVIEVLLLLSKKKKKQGNDNKEKSKGGKAQSLRLVALIDFFLFLRFLVI